jgi:hypothetical protein
MNMTCSPESFRANSVLLRTAAFDLLLQPPAPRLPPTQAHTCKPYPSHGLDMSETTIPALPSSLSSLVLSHIVPSLSVPLPPDCLATPLLQRHAFLPPSLDDPISHFQLSSSKSNDRDLLEEQLDGLARRLGSAEVCSSLYSM